MGQADVALSHGRDTEILYKIEASVAKEFGGILQGFLSSHITTRLLHLL